MNELHYKPGRFAYLFEKQFGSKLWEFLSSPQQVQLMLEAVEQGRPAILPLLHIIEDEYEEHLSSSEYPQEEVAVFINNMVKQILESKGHEHIGCGLCRGQYIKVSGMYRHKDS